MRLPWFRYAFASLRRCRRRPRTAASSLYLDAATRAVIGDGFEQLAIRTDDRRQPAGTVVLVTIGHFIGELPLRDVSFFIVDNFLRAAFAADFFGPLVHQVVRELFVVAAIICNTDDVACLVIGKPRWILLPSGNYISVMSPSASVTEVRLLPASYV